MYRNLIIVLLWLFIVSEGSAQQQAIELGDVQWIRHLDAAIAQSRDKDKDILILFQEVPGCATCRNYGEDVLSEPLIVEAIESLFIPLAVFNNKKGHDGEVLAFFDEPAWNNPVIRIVGSNKKNVVPRLARNYGRLGLVQTMIDALTKRQRKVPTYLTLLHEELLARHHGLSEATFSMYCFWTGEKTLGAIPGVVETESGFMDGKEVVRVQYDASELPFEELVKWADGADCAQSVYVDDKTQQATAARILSQDRVQRTTNFRPDNQPKYYLFKSRYRDVPMTALQANRANELLSQRKNPDSVLSPRQLAAWRKGSDH